MKFSIYMFLGQCIIFFYQYNFCAKALLGRNVKQAKAGDYTYIASIMKIIPGHPHSGGDHFCTGVIITRNDVLTAAHCMESYSNYTVQIVIGTVDLRNGTVYYPAWWQSYNKWAELHNIKITYTWNDMANIRLLIKVPDNILPVRTSHLSNTELYGAHVIMAGWGLNNNQIVPNIMQTAELKIEHNHVCERRIENIVGMSVPMDTRVLCTFVQPYILMQSGDSGGPLLFRNRLIGINEAICPSWIGASEDKQVNLHLGIHFYRDYINYMKTM